MPTINGILNTAASGLRAQQSALDVTSHNISNASTPGYSRQRAVITTNPSLITPKGVYGTGAQVVDVTQVRDQLLDVDYRGQTSTASEQQTRSDILGQVQSVLNEPTDTGLANTMDQFFSAWSDLATNPSDASTRTVVRQDATDLVNQMHQLASSFDQTRQNTETRLSDGVTRVNQLTAEVANLNKEIVSVESDGTTASDLRDQRGTALDELSTYVPIQVEEHSDGSVGVATSGISIVDGAHSTDLAVSTSGGTYGLKVASSSDSISSPGGSLGGMLQVLNTDLPSYQSKLDTLASSLVSEVNSVHETGTNPDGNTGVDFFDPSGTTAWTMALSSDVSSSASAIAAGTPDAGGAYRSGANDVALAIGGMRDQKVSGLGQQTPGDYFTGLVSGVGLDVRSSQDAAGVHKTLADQANTRRMSTSGVSVDQELVNMMQFQSAYQAAARVVTTANQMLQSLINM